jgi:hypothetical protein
LTVNQTLSEQGLGEGAIAGVFMDKLGEDLLGFGELSVIVRDRGQFKESGPFQVDGGVALQDRDVTVGGRVVVTIGVELARDGDFGTERLNCGIDRNLILAGCRRRSDR